MGNDAGTCRAACKLVNLTFKIANHGRPCRIRVVDHILLKLEHSTANGTGSLTGASASPDHGGHTVGIRTTFRNAEIPAPAFPQN